METRILAGGDAIRRRRECLACGYRFTSYERIEERTIMVVKRDGRREPFDRVKIERGVRRALEKRPVSQMEIEALVNDIEDQAAVLARQNDADEIASSSIGDLVLERLNPLDKIAYIRFAAVYRRFKDTDDFIREIRKLQRKDKPRTAKTNKAKKK
jgi:transcriptional repressor NrdR